VVQRDDLNRPPNQALEVAFEAERWRKQGRLRVNSEQDTDVHVAIVPGSAASDRSEEIDGGRPVWIGPEESGEDMFEVAFHPFEL
jgi:hypothetical protein